ncbi:NAD(P)H-dependent flavin oxidoreductase [Salibacterium halotolerans]|uniref:Probable nitronate monooxygenase n=1 Tax=Salibacterium halotolerans TaxID=1884432 RepID=A0A1I5WS50_9BACI|nr:nitronate monooxygenase [Salibacterium halotolerans]SFQ22569.1 nitronate monooxygenase [Salibacterium halotolerans]
MVWNDTALTREWNLPYPVIQAGMAGGVTTPELVTAVTQSGGLGMLGAGYMEAGQMKQAIKTIKENVSLFGVNVFVPESPEVTENEVEQANRLLQPYREALGIDAQQPVSSTSALYEKQLETVLQEKVLVCSFTFGLPGPDTVRELKKNKTTLIGTATTVEEAGLNEERGMDMVVVQGSEAGGHRGGFTSSGQDPVGTMALVPQVVDHIRIPVIASGGIMDGRGVLAALVLGASGVQMGTAFVTSEESGAHPLHKEAILNSSEEDMVITKAFSGKPARGVANSFSREMENGRDMFLPYPFQHQLTKAIRAQAAAAGQPEWMSLWSGQAPTLGRRVPAASIMSCIATQVEEQVQLF